MFKNLLAKQKNLQATAIAEGESSVSFFSLQKKANALCIVLPSKHQVVAILLPNGSDFVCALWAIVQKGLTAFPLNVELKHDEVVPLLKKANAKLVVTCQKFLSFALDATKEACADVLLIDDFSTEQTRWKRATGKAKDKAVLFLPTSGTTGNSKIVRLSQKNLETSFLGYCKKMKFKKSNKNKFLLAVPFCSAYGIMILSACLLFGFEVIVVDGVFTLDRLFKLAEHHKATHYEGSGTAILLLEKFGNRQGEYNIDSLKYIGFGGSKVSGKTVEAAQKNFPQMEFYQGYGMTEASPLIAKFERGKKVNADAVGTALKKVKIAVCVDDKIFRKKNVTGEIVVKGKNVMLGYLDNKKETDQILKNGFLHTGDIGFVDKDNCLHICGRKKNLIVSRGFNVFPEEVEECILKSGLALDAKVFGKTDSLQNEVVCAEVVPANKGVSMEELKHYLKKHLADFKQPSEIVFCQSVEKNAAGKIRREKRV